MIASQTDCKASPCWNTQFVCRLIAAALRCLKGTYYDVACIDGGQLARCAVEDYFRHWDERSFTVLMEVSCVSNFSLISISSHQSMVVMETRYRLRGQPTASCDPSGLDTH